MKPENLLLACTLAACFSCSQPTAEPAETGLTGFADSLFHAATDSGQIAGAAVLVKKDGRILLQKPYGLASVELGVPMPETGAFEIGSVTKQFTAAAIVKLASAGKLSLDDDFTQYVPMDTGGRKVTIAQLLNHTSGIPSYTEIPEFWGLSIESHPRDSLLRLVETKPFLFEPGERLIYNNTGYFILGLVIEKASGQPYEDYLRATFFEPLGMDHTYYCSQSKVVPGKVYGYNYTPHGLNQKPYLDHTWPYAAGSLCSTTGDLLIWLEALHGGNVFNDAEYRQLTEPGTLNDGSPLRYAMGLGNLSDYGHRQIGHGGGIHGFVSETRYYPDDDLYLICLVNTTGPKGAGFFAEALTWQLLEKKPYATAPFDQDTAALSGTFRGQGRGRMIEVATEATAAGLIWKEAGQQAPDTLKTYTGGGVWMRGNTRIAFQNGKWAIDHGGGYYVLDRVE